MKTASLKSYMVYTYQKSGNMVNSHERWASLLLLFLSGLYSAALILLFYAVDAPLIGNSFIFLSVAAALIYWYLQQSGNLYISAHLYGIATFLGFSYMTAQTGGIHSPLLIYMLIPAIGTTLMSTKKAGILWTILTLAWGLLLVIDLYQPLPSIITHHPGPAFLPIVAFLSLLLYLLSVMWTFEKAKTTFQEVVQEQNALLQEKNSAIELQKASLQKVNTSIVSSITYAKKIQEAVMHHGCSLNALFKETFVFFKPRDIVSGDFFWTQQLGNKKLVVAADCTGHGVPGAFMSLIGMYLLHSIVKDAKDLSPELILKELRWAIHHFLNQEKSESRDGMDIAICLVDEHEVRIASAKSTLYYLQHGRLQAFKGDNLAIGGNRTIHKEEAYRLLVLPRTEVEYVFMATDGFQDQFGGPEHKKYMKKRLVKLLEHIAPLPAQAREAKLEKEFYSWQGRGNQIDDVLILGFSPNP
jgi:serine phosphatase RsbU (regulator of sigma subunit)